MKGLACHAAYTTTRVDVGVRALKLHLLTKSLLMDIFWPILDRTSEVDESIQYQLCDLLAGAKCLRRLSSFTQSAMERTNFDV